MADKIKIHARVTKEIEITKEQAMNLLVLATGINTDTADDVLVEFTEGIDSGVYEAGYIPNEWLKNDLLVSKDPDIIEIIKSGDVSYDIDL